MKPSAGSRPTRLIACSNAISSRQFPSYLQPILQHQAPTLAPLLPARLLTRTLSWLHA